MRRTDVAIIGAGQAGLATSYCLSALGVEHVVLERGQVGQRWRVDRWPSLTLLTPNWQSRLPGFRYDGPDPDGYMGVADVVGFLERYARLARAPIEPRSPVLRVEPGPGGYIVRTGRGAWHAAHVVIATGYSDLPLVPAAARRLPPDVLQITPGDYRGPDHLPPGGVLVVGAGASGVQLADEIQASGRQVTLAVGRHLRLPRVYRGRDILWWLDAMGVLNERVDQVANIEVSRAQPSLQLVGRHDRATLDLGALLARGVRLAGRLLSTDDGRLCFDDDLVGTVAAADVKLAGLLGRIDAFIDRTQPGEVREAGPFVPCWPMVIQNETRTLDLKAERIRTVVWATGFKRRYPWLKVPVLDARGEIRHSGGVTPAPGLFVVGLQFQRTRKSAFIDGVGEDAAFIARRIARGLPREPSRKLQVRFAASRPGDMIPEQSFPERHPLP
ncbi:MAG TPA: NAD(P)/FAD-dependent oxidoreductase [Vicinamibacterales bacterium]|nr:NAD(P)/FAD-dependent oxidoreductase [Vicinamibacterales bacterium]